MIPGRARRCNRGRTSLDEKSATVRDHPGGKARRRGRSGSQKTCCRAFPNYRRLPWRVATRADAPAPGTNRMHSFNIPALGDQLTAALQRKIDQKTKPLGALGRLETLALQLGRIQHTLSPQVVRPTLFVF